MTGQEHFQRAEEILRQQIRTGNPNFPDSVLDCDMVAAAQVHATLALVEAVTGPPFAFPMGYGR